MMFDIATVDMTAVYYRNRVPLSGPPLPVTTRVWEYPWAQWVLKNAGIEPPAALLDVGCGCNPLMVELARRGYQVTGLDKHVKGAPDNPNPTGWGINPDWGTDTLSLRLGDATEELPFPNGHFDCVYSISVIEHIEFWTDEDATRQVLREMCRVTKPGGLLLITEDYTPGPVTNSVLIHACDLNATKGHRFREHIRAIQNEGFSFLWPNSRVIPSHEEIDQMRDTGQLQLCCAEHPDRHYHFTAVGYALIKATE